MKQGYWIKTFTDGSTEKGTDSDIDFQRASWTNGRLSSISGVEIAEWPYSASLIIPNTDWHQFDRLQATIEIGTIVPTRQYRVVQALIKPEHVGNYLICTQENLDRTFTWQLSKDIPNNTSEKHVTIIKDAIQPEDVDRWFSIIVYKNREPTYLLSERGTVR